MAGLTVDSLSLTPQASWPVDSSVGILAARTKDNRVKLVAVGESLPRQQHGRNVEWHARSGGRFWPVRKGV